MSGIFLAILDTMWGTASRRAPRWFTINPHNASGRRLYRLTGAEEGDLWVTNACPGVVGHAAQHGEPSVRWLRESFIHTKPKWQGRPLLVCGKVAQDTYDSLIEADGDAWWDGPVIRLKHPAARSWTKAEIARVQRQIRRIAR